MSGNFIRMLFTFYGAWSWQPGGNVYNVQQENVTFVRMVLKSLQKWLHNSFVSLLWDRICQRHQ